MIAAWKMPAWNVPPRQAGCVRDHAPPSAAEMPVAHPSLRRLLAFAVRWVLIGSITWPTCIVLLAHDAPVLPLAVMLGFAVAYAADLRRLESWKRI